MKKHNTKIFGYFDFLKNNPNPITKNVISPPKCNQSL